MFAKHLIILIVPILYSANIFCDKLEHLNKETLERWGEYCVSIPNKKLGKCEKYTSCDYLNLVQDQFKFITENVCGTVSYTPLVCCPLNNEDVLPPSSLPTTKCSHTMMANHILGGVNATFDSSPWIALLSFDEPHVKNKTYTCAGSLINDRYIVTAAHCLTVPDGVKQIATVHLGEWDFTFNDYNGDITRPIDVGVEEIISHPKYRSDHKLFDIGLIRMSRSILNEYSLNMKPINLPFNYDQLVEDAYQISGFGQTETEPTSQIKLNAHIRLVPYVECREHFNAYGGEIQEIQLCGTSSHADTCFGDSGGSLAAMLVIPDSPIYTPCFYLMGVVSFGAVRCGSNDLPSVYTNILPFLEWISENVRL